MGKQFTDRRGRLLEPPKTSIVTDTGAQVDCLNKSKLKSLGLNESSLLETELSLGCANESDADIMGAFWGKVLHKVNGNNTVVRVLFYVLRKGGNLLSRTTITKLGLLPTTFPQVSLGGSSVTSSPSATQGQVVVADTPEVRQPEGECDPDSPLKCSCPTREQVQPPQKIPFQATVKNRLRLENYIKEHFKSSAFNVCRRQKMPETQGPPMKIHTKPDAVPHLVHRPAAVPLHWREKVAKDIDADVRRGILERVPPGVPDTWCTRMVITRKKNGQPRRAVQEDGT